ncbi:MAG: hypothetical protein ACK4RS_01395, partial [Thiothrix sp.]
IVEQASEEIAQVFDDAKNRAISIFTSKIELLIESLKNDMGTHNGNRYGNRDSGIKGAGG